MSGSAYAADCCQLYARWLYRRKTAALPENLCSRLTYCLCHCAFFCVPAGVLDCTLEANNFGNVRLANFSVAGDATNCSVPRVLAPNSGVKCSVRNNVTSSELAAAGNLVLQYPLTVTPRGSVAALQPVPIAEYAASLANLIGTSPACSTCRDCMASAGAFVAQHAREASVTTLASAFGAYCAASDALKPSQLCSKVQAHITASTFGNLGRRAGGLCLGLGLCDRAYGTSCTTQVAVGTNNVSVSTATLDTCTG